MEEVKKPSVGRMVHYVAYGTPKGEFKPEHRAAVITEVGKKCTCAEQNKTDDHPACSCADCNTVGICVLNPTGIFFNSAKHDETEKAGGTWHWPEYVK